MSCKSEVTCLREHLANADYRDAARFLLTDYAKIDIVCSFMDAFADADPTYAPGDDLLLAHLVRAFSEPDQISDGLADNKYDFLEHRAGLINRTKAFCLAMYSIFEARPEACAIVVTMRNEAPYILEWIAYHKAVGFDEIFVYTNDNSDASDDLLKEMAEAGALRVCWNETALNVNPQIKAYEHALYCEPRLRRFEWVMFLDADEFVVVDKRFDYDIRRFVRMLNSLEIVPACVCFNWLWFGSGGAIKKEPGRLTDRFEIADWASQFVKSILRMSCATSMQGVHKPFLLKDAVMVGGSLEPVSLDGHDTPFQTNCGHINHYWNKSFQEFLMKQDRGRQRSIWERGTELFFQWDIEIKTENFHPLPKIIGQRRDLVERELLKNKSLGISIEKSGRMWNVLQSNICPDGSISSMFIEEKFRASLIDLIKSVDE